QLKKSEAALRKLNRELEKRVVERTTELMESNEELEMFNYAVSHELKAPLRFMNFCLISIIKMRDKNQLEEAFDVIEDMLNASNKMYQQLEDLLAFSKVGKQTIKHEKFDMYQLLKEVLKDLGREYDLAKYTIEITPQPLVFGDKNLLYYLLRNLLSNALKYSSKKEKPHIEIDVDEKKQAFIYSIKDNGVGFNMKYYHALFKYFERLHPESEFAGNGAGLSIAQRIIKRHGGEIWAEGKEGEGACFYFSLPKKAPRSKF
ncbi:MAG: ATP-binding protein, partial [Chitinophagales bacterium]